MMLLHLLFHSGTCEHSHECLHKAEHFLTVTQMIKKFPTFMAPKVSLLYSQEPHVPPFLLSSLSQLPFNLHPFNQEQIQKYKNM
jgi:hypothetical protein